MNNAIIERRYNQMRDWLANGTMTLDELIEIYQISHDTLVGRVIADVLAEDN